ncbi:hypothetical protein [Tenacibaculum dicentrarchi]|uniref:hypothetical protein n=1 Tax=Tenacibaculum dicentrarchi TaxID=669041 RepID=UPI003510F377
MKITKNTFFITLFLLLSTIISCKQDLQKKEKVTKKKFTVDYTVKVFSDIQKENDTIIKLLNECIQSKKYHTYFDFWDKSDTTILKYPYIDLYSVINNSPKDYQPVIIGINKINNKKFLIKIAVMGIYDNDFSLEYLFNLYGVRDKKNNFVLKNVISEKLKEWEIEQFNNITYFFNKKSKDFDKEVKEQTLFENELIKLFDVKKLNYKYIVCKNNAETLSIRGFEFEPTMFLNNIGGTAFQAQKTIFAGDNSAFYPHELTHLYTYEYFPKIHHLIDEGISTYLGGARELNFTEHKKKLKKYIQENNINLFEYLMDDYDRHTLIDKNSSLLYAGGALICDIIYKKRGKEGLINLMSSGTSNKELVKTLENLLDVKNKDEINSILIKHLNIQE